MRENGIDVEIQNNSGSKIENVKFYTSERKAILEFGELESNNSVDDFLSMKENQSDGDYIIEFQRVNGEKEKKSGGYYTNGGTLNSKIVFNILKDTVKVSLSDY